MCAKCAFKRSLERQAGGQCVPQMLLANAHYRSTQLTKVGHTYGAGGWVQRQVWRVPQGASNPDQEGHKARARRATYVCRRGPRAVWRRWVRACTLSLLRRCRWRHLFCGCWGARSGYLFESTLCPNLGERISQWQNGCDERPWHCPLATVRVVTRGACVPYHYWSLRPHQEN